MSKGVPFILGLCCRHALSCAARRQSVEATLKLCCIRLCSKWIRLLQVDENSEGRRKLLEAATVGEWKNDIVSADAPEHDMPEFQLTCEQA